MKLLAIFLSVCAMLVVVWSHESAWESSFPTASCVGDLEYCQGKHKHDNSGNFYVVMRYSRPALIPKKHVKNARALLRSAQKTHNDRDITRLVNTVGEPVDLASQTSLKDIGLDDTVIALGDEDVFVFPAHRVGDVVHVSLPDRDVDVRTLSVNPRIFELSDFLSDEECEHMINRVKSLDLVESAVGDSTATSFKSDVRNSEQTWVGPSQHNDDEVFERVRNRAIALTRTDPDCAEDTQVVKYTKGQHYYLHHDYSMKSSTQGNPYYQAGGNRLVTILYYLNSLPDDAGGQTVFPYANSSFTPDKHPIQYGRTIGGVDVCDINSPGLRIQPRRGMAVMFYSLFEESTWDGPGDLATLHAACDVQEGHTKWLTNQWLRNKRVLVNGKYHLYDDQ